MGPVTLATPQATPRAPRSAAGASANPSASAPALDPRAAFIVGDILSDGNSRARTFGTDSVLATRFWSAVKTGTSKDMRDNWAVGWSARYTVGVWVGNASGAAMHEVSGTSGAAPIWATVMGFLHAREPSPAPQPIAGLVKTAVRFDAAQTNSAGMSAGSTLGRGVGRDARASSPQPLEAARQEWFLESTQQAIFATQSEAASAYGISARGQKDQKVATKSPAAPGAAVEPQAARITAPTTGTIIALDPDIPPIRQKLQFTATGDNVNWLIDGKTVGRGTQVAWLPWPGRHVVQIQTQSGQVLDEIRMEVRGAGVIRNAGIDAAQRRSTSR